MCAYIWAGGGREQKREKDPAFDEYIRPLCKRLLKLLVCIKAT